MINYRTFVTIAVAYGIERINREVSHWMRGLSDGEEHPQIPFIATRGYDSVVWSRLYSRDNPDLEDYQKNQVGLPYLSHSAKSSYSKILMNKTLSEIWLKYMRELLCNLLVS